MAEQNTSILVLLKSLRLFEGLDDAQLGQVAEVASLVSLAEGQELALPQDRDVPFYVVVEGKLSQLWPRRKEEQILLLKKSDFFGADVLFLGKQQSYRIVARTAAKLLAIEADQFAPLVKALPPLQTNLKRLLYIYSLVRSKHFDWLEEDETVYLIVRKHLDYLVVSLLGPLGLFSFGMIVLLLSFLIEASSFRLAVEWGGLGLLVSSSLWAAWQVFDWSNDYYIVTDQRVVWLERVLALYDSRQEAPLVSVKSEETKSTFLGRLLGFGDVVTQAFMGQVVFRHIAEPVTVRELIDQLRRRALSQQASLDTQTMERIIRRKIDPLPDLPAQTAASATALPAGTVKPLALPRFLRLGQPGSRGQRLADFFKTRLEEGNVITYRKHLFYLLTKIWLPSLTILTLAGLSGWLVWRSLSGQIRYPTPLAIILLALLAEVFPVLWWLYQFVDWRNDIYRITPDQIIDSERKPLGDELTKSAPLENIVSLDYERVGLLGILLNYGSVYINVGTESRLSWDNIHDPARAQRDIFRAMFAFRRKKQLAESTREWERVSDWLAAYHRQAEDLRRTQNLPKPDRNSG